MPPLILGGMILFAAPWLVLGLLLGVLILIVGLYYGTDAVELLRLGREGREQRFRSWERYDSQGFSWDLELDGVKVAVLTDPHGEDMFWTKYRITPVDPPIPNWEARLSTAFEDCSVVIRDTEFHKIAKTAFAGGPPFLRDGFVSLRGTDVNCPKPTLIGRFWMSCRSRDSHPESHASPETDEQA